MDWVLHNKAYSLVEVRVSYCLTSRFYVKIIENSATFFFLKNLNNAKMPQSLPKTSTNYAKFLLWYMQNILTSYAKFSLWYMRKILTNYAWCKIALTWHLQLVLILHLYLAVVCGHVVEHCHGNLPIMSSWQILDRIRNGRIIQWLMNWINLYPIVVWGPVLKHCHYNLDVMN